MKISVTPPKELLEEYLMYVPESGELFWKRRDVSQFEGGIQSPEHNAAIWNGRFAGKPVNAPLATGHKTARIAGKTFLAHRLIWKMAYGADPNVIDHIDGDPSNNRLSNLRSVRQTENTRNGRLSKNSTSGYNGVTFDKRRNKWVAVIMVDRKKIHLGQFDILEDAVKARGDANRLHGFHINHGKPRAA